MARLDQSTTPGRSFKSGSESVLQSASDEVGHFRSIHGRVIAAEAVPPAALGAEGPAGVTIGPVHRRMIEDAPPAGEVVFQASLGWTMWVARQRDSIVVRYGGRYDFVIADDLRSIERFETPGGSPDFGDVLLYGAVLSVLETFSGAFCLHASTVEIDGCGFGLFGRSGQGKSTVAALMVSAGAGLVADDVTVLRPASRRVLPGLLELRLRDTARDVAMLFPESARRTTVDGRIAVRALSPPSANGVDLTALIVPAPDPTTSEVAIRRLSSIDAIARLLPSGRLVGWVDPAYVAREFAAVMGLAEQFQVFEIRVPWGRPFHEGLGEQLMEIIAAVGRG